MKIALIDNYDSFTYNLVQYLNASELLTELKVFRNDQFELETLEAYDVLVLSPGPGIPEEAGLLLESIRCYAERKPILGICLGHQAIAEAFGGQLRQLTKVYHGLASTIHRPKGALFEGLPNQLQVGRYHSWVVDQLPKDLQVLGYDSQEEIMALQYQQYPVFGLQFHPESVLSPDGATIIQNFLAIAKEHLS